MNETRIPGTGMVSLKGLAPVTRHNGVILVLNQGSYNTDPKYVKWARNALKAGLTAAEYKRRVTGQIVNADKLNAIMNFLSEEVTQ